MVVVLAAKCYLNTKIVGNNSIQAVKQAGCVVWLLIPSHTKTALERFKHANRHPTTRTALEHTGGAVRCVATGRYGKT